MQGAMQRAAARRLKANLEGDVNEAMARIQAYTATELAEVEAGLRESESDMVERLWRERKVESLAGMREAYRRMGVELRMPFEGISAAIAGLAEGLRGGRG